MGVITGLSIMVANNEDKSVGQIRVDCGNVFKPQQFVNKEMPDVLGQPAILQQSSATVRRLRWQRHFGKHGVLSTASGCTGEGAVATIARRVAQARGFKEISRHLNSDPLIEPLLPTGYAVNVSRRNCISPLAPSRCRLSRAWLGHKPIHRGRCA
jgi:hypothetical protein